MRYLTAFAGPPGHMVFVSLIAPEQPQALVLVVHGAGSYLGPYLPFAWEVAARGIAAALLDLPGHGFSDGVAAHTRSYRTYLDAIDVALSWAQAVCPAPATFLAGESYGAVLALLHTARRGSAGPAAPAAVPAGRDASTAGDLPCGPTGGGRGPADAPARIGDVAGLVLSAPAFRVAGVSHRALAAVRVLARVLPRLRLPRGTPLAFTRNPVAGEIVRRDPLLNRRLTAAYAAELVRAGEEAARLAPRLDVPVLFLISHEDPVVDNGAGREVFSRLGEDHRTWEEFSGHAHALFLEDPQGMAARVSEWVRGRGRAAGASPSRPSWPPSSG
ncbi:MAG: alpha/beta fold hydrolase [Bacillota bacterium]|nr:alpha/beta fold hydrolase [Bacillota bacterium]